LNGRRMTTPPDRQVKIGVIGPKGGYTANPIAKHLKFNIGDRFRQTSELSNAPRSLIGTPTVNSPGAGERRLNVLRRSDHARPERPPISDGSAKQASVM
jgi:hypothetical protein